MEAALKAIAAPRRRQILQLVRDDELSAGEIASHFDVTRPAVSQHLNVLKEAGLVSERRNGTRRLYRARPEGLADLKEFLTEEDGALEISGLEAGSSQRSTRRRAGRRRLMQPLVAFPICIWRKIPDPRPGTTGCMLYSTTARCA